MKFNLTSAQDILLQGVLSALASALLGALAAGIQQISVHGFDWNVVLTVIITAFAGLFGNALKNFVPGHVQQEMQAYKDTIAQLQSALNIQQIQAAPTVKRPATAPTQLAPRAIQLGTSAYVPPQQSDIHGG